MSAGRSLRALWLVAVAAVVAVVLAFAALRFADSARGHALLLDQLFRVSPKSGLTVAADRIDGSLFGRATIHGLRLGDPTGVFATAPRVELDWRPLALIDNRLQLHALHIPDLALLRRPALRPSGDPRILPSIDIVVGDLRVDRLRLAASVTGRAETVALAGTADIEHGRARLDLTAHATTAADAVRVHLDAEPDRNRFDVAATIAAPARGVIASLAGLDAALGVELSGRGSWADWHGVARGTLGAKPLLDLALSARDGRFAAAGTAAPALLLDGLGARLVAPQLVVDAAATRGDARWTARLHARGPALDLTAGGRIDPATQRFDGFTADALLLRTAALHPRLSGRDIRLHARLSGGLGAPVIDYALTSPAFAFGRTGFERFAARGTIDTARRPFTVPVTATAARLTGVGTTAAPLLTNLRLAGPLVVARGALTGTGLAVSSDRVRGTGTLTLRFADGDYAATIDAALPRYAVPGFGVADLTARLRAVPAGAGTRVTGPVAATLTRAESAFVAKLLHGNARLTADVDVAPNLAVDLRNARLAAPGLTLTGSARQTPAGSVTLAATGSSSDYGPLTLALAGAVDTPVVDLTLARPGLGIGLAAVTAHVAPTPAGWRFDARAGSSYGMVAARGLFRGGSGPVVVDLDEASAAGLSARGSLAQTAAGPFAGRLDLGGPGLHGALTVAAAGAVQRADLALTAAAAQLALGTPVTIARGSLAVTALLRDAGPEVTGRFDAADVRRGTLTVAAASGSARYADRRGEVAVKASGDAGAPFAVEATATLGPDHVRLAAHGTADKRALTLDHPAEFARTPGGWQLAPVTLVSADGRAEVSGSWGDALAVHARLDRLSLSLLQIAVPGLTFTGKLSGTVDLAMREAGSLPDGSAALRVTGLSRTGLAAASLPVDVAINAALAHGTAAARATIVRGGVVEGRIQAQLRDVPAGGGSLAQRVLAAPLFAQARYDGPAEALWPLAGVEAIDVRGAVQIAADVGGRLGDPVLTGTVHSAAARFETATLGTVVENIALDGRFNAARLDLASFSGTVGKDGRVSGSGSVGLSAAANFPIDLKLDLKNAQLLNRDDLRATLTGPLAIRSTADTAKISGKLTVERGRLRIGRTAVEDVTVLDVREINAERVGRRPAKVDKPTKWLLDVALAAANRLEVTGMGIESEWRGDLRVTGAATAPVLVGRVQLVRGDYDFAGKRFALTRGDLRFNGGYPPDPVVDVAAENTQGGFTAQLTITGTAQRPEIKFGSVPALPEDEVLSRVLFGASITALSAPEAVQLAGALASLRNSKGSGALNPINLVRRKLGIDRLRIVPADITRNRKTSVAAGQYIGRRVYVELATDAQGYTGSNIEVSLTRALSVLSEVATQGGTSVNLRWKRDY